VRRWPGGVVGWATVGRVVVVGWVVDEERSSPHCEDAAYWERKEDGEGQSQLCVE
jgi:hypothetical protein